jgi:hypothetical protein
MCYSEERQDGCREWNRLVFGVGREDGRREESMSSFLKLLLFSSHDANQVCDGTGCSQWFISSLIIFLFSLSFLSPFVQILNEPQPNRE